MHPKRSRLRFSAALRSAVVPVLLAALLWSGCSRTPAGPPPTEKRPVTDEYYGMTVVDNYRWLDNLSDPAVRKWNDEQNAYARSILDKVPARDAIIKRLTELAETTSARYSGLEYQGKLFAMKSQPPKNQPFLVSLTSADDTSGQKIIVDPNQLNPAGTTAIDWYVPSRDGKLVAVSLSENGSEDGTVNVFDAVSGAKLPDLVPRAQYPTASGSLQWNADASGFYYTRYPQGDERPAEDANFYQQIYFHKLGTPSTEDTYVIGKEFPRIAECALSSSPDGRWLLVSVANGDGGDFEHYLMGPGGKWTQITTFADRIVSVQFGSGSDVLYLLSLKGAPNGTIKASPLSNPKLAVARTVVPESDVAIASFLPAGENLFVTDIIGGPMQVRVFDARGRFIRTIPLPDLASVQGIVRAGGVVVVEVETYLQPSAWYTYDVGKGTLTRSPLAMTSPVSFDDIEVTREFARSADGTRVPMNILRKKGTVMNGNLPVLLYGYGGYKISETPGFSPTLHMWLEQGGVYVVANLRGGGEYGERWHEEGRLTKKQNVFDDFAACARHLIDTGYTNPGRLAIEGGSNGGLLMGAALTQHPELYRAVVSHVGIYDMLRVELFPNGAFNVTEFGTVKDPAQFKALYAYSPYHHVVDGTAYPAVLFLTGDNDGRVDPANSRKMTARLQAATKSGLPILLRTNAHAGHGIGTGLSARIAQDADVYSFLFDELKMTYKEVGK